MNSVELISSFSDFARDKNIDKPTMISVLEEVFRTMIRKKFGSDENFNVIINPESGDLEMWRTREIVDDNSEDIWDFDKIPLAEAKLIEPDFEIGEEVAELIKLEDFGRRVVQTARQTLIQKIKDIEKESLYDKYKDLVGELVTSEVYQILGRELILLDNDDNELILPKTEMISKIVSKGRPFVRLFIRLRWRMERLELYYLVFLRCFWSVYLSKRFQKFMMERSRFARLCASQVNVLK